MDLQHFSICDLEFIDVVTRPLCFVTELTFDRNTYFYCSYEPVDTKAAASIAG